MEHLLPLYREKKAITIERKAILCNERKARQRRPPLYSYIKLSLHTYERKASLLERKARHQRSMRQFFDEVPAASLS